MFVFYALDSGKIRFTAEVEGWPASMLSSDLGVLQTDQEFGDLSDYEVVDGRLVIADLVAYRGKAKAKVVVWASATLSRFTAGYPPEEVLSWSAKLPAARRVLAGGREQMIEIEAQALGVPVAALAAKVVEKGGQYEAVVALAAGMRGKTQNAIEAAQTANAVDQVLATALAEANVTLASLGVA